MDTRKRLFSILEKSPFGLTSGEISRRARVTETTVKHFLEKNSDKIVKTKAGKTYFYRSIKVVMFFLILLIPVSAMSSGTYVLEARVMDNGGGETNSSNYTLQASIGQISGLRDGDFEFCAGFLCSFYEIIVHGRVTFLLEFNVSGNANDEVYAGVSQVLGQYTPGGVQGYYACLEDPTLQDTPTYGIAHSGTALKYVNISFYDSYSMRVSQEIPGNRFIIPVTSGGCGVVSQKMPQISEYGILLQPFLLSGRFINAVELMLDYPAFDLTGQFDKSGAFTLVVEKNATDEDNIIVRPV